MASESKTSKDSSPSRDGIGNNSQASESGPWQGSDSTAATIARPSESSPQTTAPERQSDAPPMLASAEDEAGSTAAKLPALGAKPTRLSRWWAQLEDMRRFPAFLVSLITHTILLLILALWSYSSSFGLKRSFDFAASMDNLREPPKVFQAQLATGAKPPPSQTVDVSLTPPKQARQSAASNLSELLKVKAPKQNPQEQLGDLDRLLDATALSLSASFASTGVDGRQLDERKEVALARGGSLKSEAAVERALEWLAAHQLPGGGWSLIHDQGRCNGQCKNNGSKDRFDTAATGLALLAFLGAGYTHEEGKHRETVRKGVYFLLQVMEETPEGGSFLYQCDRGMYNHGIATFALCEAYQLTHDKDLQRPAQQAVNFIVSAQHYRGGWGYLPKQPGDLTLSGWQIMALKSASAAGLDVPPTTILKIDPFLDSQQSESGVFFGYTKPGKNPTCTSIGLLVRLFRGMTHTDPSILQGAEYFQKVGRSNGDAYYNYYVTLFLFHVGGPFWEDWNPKMREHLIRTQATSGHERGSWFFDNPFGREGGRVYTTAMCAMTLEVYYRFSPLYQQSELPFEL